MAFYKCNKCRRRECNIHIPIEVTEPRAVCQTLHCPVSGRLDDCDFTLVDHKEYECTEKGQFDPYAKDKAS